MRPAVTAILVSLTMGLAVGIAYGLSGIRSPAPPLIALVGLLGMVLGEQAVTMTKDHFFPSATQERRTHSRTTQTGH
jgi:XapX domain-containing protein